MAEQLNSIEKKKYRSRTKGNINTVPTPEEYAAMRSQLPNSTYGSGYNPYNAMKESLMGKFNISEDTASGIVENLPSIDNHPVYQAPNAKSIQDSANRFPDKQFQEGDMYYGIYNPIQRINEIYAPSGGTKQVMANKQSAPLYPEYERKASDIYSLGAVRQRLYPTHWNQTVKPYNTLIQDTTNPMSTALIVTNNKEGGQSYPGYVKIGARSLDKNIGNQGSVNDDKDYSVVNHEFTHQIQDVADPEHSRFYNEDNKRTGNPESYGGVNNSDYYNSAGFENTSYLMKPSEIHARAAAINQSYAQRNKTALDTPEKVDTYVNNIVNNYELYKAMKEREVYGEGNRKGMRDSIEGDNYYSRNNTPENAMASDPEFIKKVGLPFREAQQAFELIEPWMITGDLVGADGKIDKAKAAEWLKALIMTTAKNNKQIPQQPNGVFDNGFNIS